MSNRVRFIDLVRPVMGLLPEVEQPLKKVLFPSFSFFILTYSIFSNISMTSWSGLQSPSSFIWSAVRFPFTVWSSKKELILCIGSELSLPQTREPSWNSVFLPLSPQVWSCSSLPVQRSSKLTNHQKKTEIFSKVLKNFLDSSLLLVKPWPIFCQECTVKFLN